MFFVCLRAFVILNNIYTSIVVWRGSSLKCLNREEFNFLKNYYGLENLRLSNYYYFDDDDDNDNDYDFDD